jgi:hypothetical protein
MVMTIASNRKLGVMRHPRPAAATTADGAALEVSALAE